MLSPDPIILLQLPEDIPRNPRIPKAYKDKIQIEKGDAPYNKVLISVEQPVA